MLQDYKKPFYHFSIDDVIDSLIQVSDSSSDLFSNYFFQFLEMIHNKYDCLLYTSPSPRD